MDCSAPMELQMESQSQKQEVYAAIERDVLDLKMSMEIMHELVHMQQDDLDTIEDFIVASKSDVVAAERELVAADTSYGYWGGVIGVVGMMGIVLAVLF
jgi:t-SNARE complex subunit (syntaxin)